MPSTTFMTHIIDQIRSEIGRTVQFDVPTLSGCSACTLDPVTNTSTDSFCPTCSGVYWIKIPNLYTVSGHIFWADSDVVDWHSGGIVFQGDCRVSIKYTPAHLTMVRDAERVLVDSKILVVDSYKPRGVPNLNRIIVNLREIER